ncbi:hypothetical protein Tsubulata_019205 [Turnera subulata]|uniref:Uncharacterized protein n=1 Tax=Turnera subulata TaxID=218843 RepID=A0A9Q0FZT1_9ROSI|nr:hypothetical protein Tsubulata_019205 [Turnera subulata]
MAVSDQETSPPKAAGSSPWSFKDVVTRPEDSLVGKTIRIDVKTRDAERGKFAKVVVEVDLMKPLKEACLALVPPMATTVEPRVGLNARVATAVLGVSKAVAHRAVSFTNGEWMNAPRESRRWSRCEPRNLVHGSGNGHSSTAIHANTIPSRQGSRFQILQEEDILGPSMDHGTEEADVSHDSRLVRTPSFGYYLPTRFPSITRVAP